MSASLPVPSSAGLSMSSLEIAELVESRHEHVKTSIERLVAKGVISQPSLRVGPKSPNGKEIQVYAVGKRDSYVIVAQLSPEFTARLVDRWQELEGQVAQSAIAIPQTLPEALRLAADLADKVAEQTAKLIEQQPKAEFHDRVTQSEDLLTIREAAKVLRTGERRLFEFLRKEGMLMRSNLPYQDFMNRDLFRVVETPWTDAYARERISTKTCLTQKGLAYVRLLQDKLALFAEEM